MVHDEDQDMVIVPEVDEAAPQQEVDRKIEGAGGLGGEAGGELALALRHRQTGKVLANEQTIRCRRWQQAANGRARDGLDDGAQRGVAGCQIGDGCPASAPASSGPRRRRAAGML